MRSFLAVSYARDTPPTLRGPIAAAVGRLAGAVTVHPDDGGWVAFGADQHPSHGRAGDQHVSGQHLNDQHLSGQHLNDQHVSGQYLSDQHDRVDAYGPAFTVRLGRAARTRAGDVSTAILAAMLKDGTDLDGQALAQLVPPFAAAHRAGPGKPVVVATDWLGYRQVFWWQGEGVAAVSTSALALQALAGAPLNRAAVGLQSLVGWQVGLATLFGGVAKVPDGSVAVLAGGRVQLRRYIEPTLDLPGPAPTMAEVVDDMAELLEDFLTGYLGDHPTTVLQLTGGQDTRVLLCAVPAKLRSGLRALTLDVHGGADSRHAARLAELCGLDHQIYWLDDQPHLDAPAAYALVLAASAQLDCMGSPLAMAALLRAEGNLEQGHRLSGLGGETCRGFYYFGQPRHAVRTKRLVAQLARWRLYANEAVLTDALEPAFARSAHKDALDLIEASFVGTSTEWLRATDQFYLFQRMQRWSGAHGSVAAASRFFINPMFDRRFVQLAHAVSPDDKRGGRLTGALIERLDPKLAAVALDSGLIPARLGARGIGARTAATMVTAHRVARKVRQRIRRAGRTQLGASEMAALVVAQWRAEPELVAPLRATGVVRGLWLDQLLSGKVDAPAGTVAFLANLLVANGYAARPEASPGVVSLP